MKILSILIITVALLQDGDCRRARSLSYSKKKDSLEQRSDSDRLYRKLFDNYNRHVRPCLTKNCSDTTVIQFGIAPINARLYIKDFEKQMLHTDSWFRMVYNDRRLTWDPRDFGGISDMRLPQRKIWLPDVTLYNRALVEGNDNKEWQETPLAVVYSSGSVLLVPQSLTSTYCQFNSSATKQTCHFKFGSWTYDGYKLDLGLYEGSNTCDLNDFVGVITPSGWEAGNCNIVKHTKYYPCCSEPYPSLEVEFEFKRRTNNY